MVALDTNEVAVPVPAPAPGAPTSASDPSADSATAVPQASPDAGEVLGATEMGSCSQRVPLAVSKPDAAPAPELSPGAPTSTSFVV